VTGDRVTATNVPIFTLIKPSPPSSPPRARARLYPALYSEQPDSVGLK